VRALHLVKTSVGATWALRQVRELARLGIDVHVALPEGPLLAEYASAGVKVHAGQFSLPVRRPDQWSALFQRFRELVEHIQPDIIHSHFVGTTLTMRLALGRRHPVRRLFQVPGPLHLEHALYRRGELSTAGKSDYWMGSCRWTCDRYRSEGVPDSRIFLGYYGSDLGHTAPVAPGTLRTELGLDTKTRIVGMVAYLYPPKRYLGQRRGLKGHEDLIDALAVVAEREPDVVGVFVGGAWANAIDYERRVRTYAQEKLGGRAIFLGTRPDVPALYPDFDVVVHPSHSENVGGAAESLLIGVPTVATNVGGFPDLVIPGETGWLVPPRDPTALATAILDALSDPERARTLACKGQALARSLMDVRTNAADVANAYDVMLGSQVASLA
jgi:glycosyltransferase involved in cell wall biosynthesis